MAPSMKDLIKMVNQMAMASISGKMEKFTKDNGLTVWKTGLEFGGVQKETLISVNGNKVKLMDMVYIHGLTVIDTKASLLIV